MKPDTDRTDTHTDGRAALSDRVRSLRLGEPTAARRGASGGFLPWALAAVLLLTTAVFGVKAFRAPRAADDAAPGDTGRAAAAAPAAPVGDVVLEAKGYVIAAHQIQVSPKIAGMIEWLDPSFEEGRHFKEGAVLARLEKVDYQADYDRTVATRDAAKKRLEELELSSPLELEQAVARQASAKTNMEYLSRERERVLRAGNSASARERDEAESLYVQAVKTYDDATKAVALLGKAGPRPARVAAVRADMMQAEADVAKAKWRLEQCEIKAPVTGTILTKKAERGNLVNPVAFNVSASLCEMADLRDLEVDLSIQERDYDKVAPGQECAVRPEAFSRNEAFRAKYPDGYRGRVSRLMPIADRAKGSVSVRVTIDRAQIPPQEEGVYLKPEMSVLVWFKKVK